VLKEDLLAYTRTERLSIAKILVTAYKHPALLAVAAFRLGKSLQRLPAPLKLIGLALYYVLIYPPVRLLTGVELPLSGEIGPGLTIWHFGNTIFGGGVRAGKNLTVNQGVLIARKSERAPIAAIGDNVTLGARCVVLCEYLGDGAVVGAGAVVVKDVPPGATVVGNPAIPVERKGRLAA
jgi:serine O-acetyltransferase